MKNNEMKNIDITVDAVKQLITLSTAVFVATATLQEKFFGFGNFFNKILLAISLILFLISVFFGIKTLHGIVMIIESAEINSAPSVFVPQIELPARTQIKSFYYGLIIIIINLLVLLIENGWCHIIYFFKIVINYIGNL